jgi:glucose/arabinose dehydrogenase
MTTCRRVVSVGGVVLLLAWVLAACVGDAHGSSAGGSTTSAQDGGTRPAGAYPPAADAHQIPVPLSGVRVRATRVASLGEMVTDVTSDPSRDALFITTLKGRILRLPIVQRAGFSVPDTEDLQVMVDLTGSVFTEAVQGMFALELLPNTDRAVVSYTALDGSVTARLLRVDGSRLVDDVPNPVVIQVPYPLPGHEGGGLAVDAKGDLLLSLGDGDSGDFDPPRAQDASFAGGVVRIPAAALAGDTGRPVPSDQVTTVAKGLRNPWRIAVDPSDDRLWIGDVGEATWEELDTVPSVTTQTSLTNFGWPRFEGADSHRADSPVVGDGMTAQPVYDYRHDDGGCAISIGQVVRGDALPQLDGALLFGDYCLPKVSAIRSDGTRVVDGPRVIVSMPANVVALSSDSLGATYVLTIDGDVYRLDPGTWKVPDVAAAKGPVKDDNAPSTTAAPQPAASECAVVDAIASLDGMQTFAPAKVKTVIAGVQQSLAAALPDAPEPRRRELQVLVGIFDQLATTAQQHGYDVHDPALAGAIADLTKGTGAAEGFPGGVRSVMGVEGDCRNGRIRS